MKVRKQGTTKWFDFTQAMGYSECPRLVAETFADEYGLEDGDVVEVKGKDKFRIDVKEEITVTARVI